VGLGRCRITEEVDIEMKIESKKVGHHWATLSMWKQNSSNINNVKISWTHWWP